MMVSMLPCQTGIREKRLEEISSSSSLALAWSEMDTMSTRGVRISSTSMSPNSMAERMRRLSF